MSEPDPTTVFTVPAAAPTATMRAASSGDIGLQKPLSCGAQAGHRQFVATGDCLMEYLEGAMNAPPPAPPPRNRGVKALLAGAILVVVVGVFGVSSVFAASPS